MSELDVSEVARRAVAAAGGARVDGIRRLPGGVSSLTYAATVHRGQTRTEVVLKIAPPGLEPVRNRDVLRQARLLDRLADVDGFPTPRVLFSDAGDPPEVPPLFVMELRAGQSFEPALDLDPAPPSPEVAAERMRVAARALATLQALPPARLGLAEEPVTSVRAELDRWRRLLATVDEDIAVGHEKLYQRLAAAVPADIEPVVLHGDYRCANMLFTGERLSAVIDWEIWSVGDPRSDLGWLLMHTAPPHVFHEDRSPAARAAASRLPSAEELLSVYLSARSAGGTPQAALDGLASELGWFRGVAAYKVASTVAAIYKRDRKRAEPDPSLATAAAHLDGVLAAGHAALDRR